MNDFISRDIIEKEVSTVVISMMKGKIPKYDEIPIEFS